MSATTEQLIAALEPITSRVRTDVTAIKVPEGGSRWVSEPLTKARLTKHIEGGLPRGCCPIKAGESVTSLAVLDLDSHKGAVTWAGMSEAARKITDACSMEGVTLVPFRSSGGKGLHLFALWDAPQDAYSVRQFFVAMLAAVGFRSGTKGVQDGEIEVFPKQNNVPLTGFGNQFILPLAGASVPLDHNLQPMQRDDILAIDWPVSDPVPLVAKPEPVVFTGALTQDFKQLQAHLAAIPNSGDKELDYDQWRNIIFAIHHETGGSDDGLALAHEFSSRSSKYDPDLLDNRIWPYITSDRDSAITGKTIGFMAREHGYVEDVTDDFDVVEPEDETETLRTRVNKFLPVAFHSFAEFRDVDYIVEDTIPVGGMGVIYGESGSGKTFFAADLALAVARGVPWRGKYVEQGTVVYVCAEGVPGFRNRMLAYKMTHKITDDMPFHIITAAPDLMGKVDVKAVLAAIAHLGPIKLILLDTWARVMLGGDENSVMDTGVVLKACEQFHHATGAMVLALHHTGKDTSRGARGSTALRAACDVEIAVTAEATGHNAKITKQKDGELGVVYGFTLNQVVVGTNKHGKAVTSCTVAHCGAVPEGGQTDGKVGHTEVEVLAGWSHFTEKGCRVVSKEELLAWLRGEFLDADPKNWKTNWKRAMKSLAKKGHFTDAGSTLVAPVGDFEIEE
jgi:hypothetical protein